MRPGLAAWAGWFRRSLVIGRVGRAARRLWVGAWLGLLCLGLLTACVPGGAPVMPAPVLLASPAPGPLPEPSGTLVWGSLDEPRTLNPLTAEDEASRWATGLVFDGLLRSNQELGLEGKLAKDYAGSADGLIFTVRINTTARWHDGASVTAEDVKFTFDQLLDPAAPTIDKAPYARLDRVEIVDPGTLRFVLREPDAALPAALTVGIVPRHLFAGRDLRDPALARAPVGNGAFRFEAWTPGESLTFTADPHYYFVPGARIARFVWRRFADADALSVALARGEVDAAAVDARLGERLRVERGWTARPLQGGVRRLVFQTQRPPLDAAEVRAALAAALDRDALMQAAREGEAVASTADYPPVTWAYSPSPLVAPRPPDPERLRALAVRFADASATAGREPAGTPLVVLHDAASAELRAAAQAVAAEWTAAGVPAQAEAVPAEALQGRLGRGEFDAALLAESVLTDPDLSRRYSRDAIGAGNVGRYAHPEVDRLIDLGLQTTAAAERTRVYHRLQELLIQEAPAVPLYAPVRLLVGRPELGGLLPSPVDPLWNAAKWWLKP